MVTINNILNKIAPSDTVRIAELAKKLKKEGKDIISLSLGESDLDSPDFALEGATKAIVSGDTRYPPVPGHISLREAIVRKLELENKLKYNVADIVVCNGAKHALFNIFFSVINPGDEVILFLPTWVSYSKMVELAGGIAKKVKCNQDFSIDIESFKQTINHKTKAIVLNSPNNPSGAVYNEKELSQIAEILVDHPDVIIISDDIYENIIYDMNKVPHILDNYPNLIDRTCIVNGVSKGYAMTGWRVGYVASKSQDIVKSINKLQTHTTGGVCTIAEGAALGAISHTNKDRSFFQDQNNMYKEKRDIALKILQDVKGLSINVPQGAFYLFIDCQNYIGRKGLFVPEINNSIDIAQDLLDHALVAVVPGEAFEMQGFFRMSYALSKDSLIMACNRIKKYFSELSDAL
ncbi:MAG: aspartate aminotransferase [Candidatus Xenolissoclinum pacificiensis L6]|uniref:Aminotransferase n=1 Tax=Candidatus Xenolissoclinum pacificiensis L6 TaxID=1401685 RepID=W2V0F2_9RICK|nr:MAG: aspartate aminotransferase [Candidatus Xenolissoclinum pacificiensis L6]